MQKFIINLTTEDFSILDNQSLECFVLNSSLSDDFVTNFSAKAKEKQKLVLAGGEKSTDFCSRFNLDGLILDLSKSENISTDFKDATKGLKNKFIGIISRNRRHEAMLASECEPDFVIFKAWTDGLEKIKDLTDWYSDMFLIQSAILPVDDNIDFANFKTDFIVLDDIKYKIFVAKK